MQRLYVTIRDRLGRTANNVDVYVYDTGTTDLADIWENDESTPLDNPIPTGLDGLATAKVTNGSYDVVYALNGVTTTIEDIRLYDADDTAIGDMLGSNNLSDVSTASTALTNISPATTQGDIIFRGASIHERLAKGTAGQVLTMNAGATAPEWQTPSGAGGGLLGHAFNSAGSSTSGTGTVTILSQAYTPQANPSTIYLTGTAMWYNNANTHKVDFTQSGGSGTFSTGFSTNISQNATASNIGYGICHKTKFANTSTSATTFNFRATGGGSRTSYGSSSLTIIEVA